MNVRERLFSTYCLDFDGVTAAQRVSVPNFNLAAPYTLLQWVWPRAYRLAIWRKSLGAPWLFYGVRTAPDRQLLYDKSGAFYTAVAAFTPPLNRWSLVGIRANSPTSFNFVLNGVPSIVYAPAAGDIEDNVAPMYIGYNSFYLALWNGYIDEFFHAPIALSDAELMEVFYRGYARRMTGSLLNLRMEAGTGLIAFDTSGAGNNGTLVNNPTWTRVAKYALLTESGV